MGSSWSSASESRVAILCSQSRNDLLYQGRVLRAPATKTFVSFGSDVCSRSERQSTIFLTRVSVLLGRRSFYGTRCVPLVLRPDESLNVDEPADWLEAERRLAYPERIGETVWLAGLAKVD